MKIAILTESTTSSYIAGAAPSCQVSHAKSLQACSAAPGRCRQLKPRASPHAFCQEVHESSSDTMLDPASAISCPPTVESMRITPVAIYVRKSSRETAPPRRFHLFLETKCGSARHQSLFQRKPIGPHPAMPSPHSVGPPSEPTFVVADFFSTRGSEEVKETEIGRQEIKIKPFFHL
jgi:hypothetical protein